jgi:hypothetical protein
MRYFVTGEYVEPGPLLPPEQLGQMLEQVVIPSLENMAALEKEKRIVAGGILSAARAGVLILEASSHEEVSKILMSLPFWGLLKWQVTPIESFEFRAKLEREGLARMKK